MQIFNDISLSAALNHEHAYNTFNRPAINQANAKIQEREKSTALVCRRKNEN